MKAPAASETFVPAEAPDEEEAAEDEAEEGDTSALLGDAFDALQDGDREGFVRLMGAAFTASKE